eukprot:gnl/Carplike_NY0171/12370_a17843_115.p1 GENE.gnl/Carplike_NY0171/12370_a17843_115~~gnl/Carplike_NY0171/12370_a17843_115.p1  ORF type:complete len:350 (+),score=38.43 gnl/Carplike_NY0171/12370_a17843_115:101-1051(+)
MWIEISCSLLNIVGDLIFLGIFKLKASYAALSTVIAHLLPFIVIIFLYCSRKESIRPKVTLTPDVLKAPFDKEIFLKTFGSSFVFLIQETFFSLGGILISKNIANYVSDEHQHTEYLAAFGASHRLANMVFLPCLGIGTSLPPLIAYNLGKLNYQRVFGIIWKGLLTIITFASFLCGLFLSLLPFFASLFSDGDDDLTELIISMTKGVLIISFFCPFLHTVTGIAQGERNVAYQAVLYFCTGFPMIVFSYVLPLLFKNGLDAFKYILTISYSIADIFCLICFPFLFFKYYKKTKTPIDIIDFEDSKDESHSNESKA